MLVVCLLTMVGPATDRKDCRVINHTQMYMHMHVNTEGCPAPARNQGWVSCNTPALKCVFLWSQLETIQHYVLTVCVSVRVPV